MPRRPARRRPPALASGLLAAALGTALAAAPASLGAQAPAAPASAPDATPGAAPAPRAAKSAAATRPTLYTVGYAHLDTEWNWDYVQTIDEYLPNTLHDNFTLFEKYPAYVFNFSGANRYHMMKEYYPADYARMAAYIKAGRWFPAGSSMEEGDVNAPSAEAILRQVLYGNRYFRSEFGVASDEYMLPDCFGFPWSLPSILAHAGVKGFSTQKLVWGSSVPDQPTTPYQMEGMGVPFNVGRWVGPDGRSVVAALNPGDYGGNVTEDLSSAAAMDSSVRRNPQTWLARLKENERKLGVATDYHYYGTGDVGGSPGDSTVMWVQRSATNRAGAIDVRSARADQFFRDLAPARAAKLPAYAGEMELTNHSAGSLTSEAYQKRWLRRNEVLADAAEKASLGAAWLGARAYPKARLDEAWRLVMGGHFHDIAAGTAIPRAYEYAWNDDVLAGNQFAAVLSSATEAVAASLDTRARGVPVVVFNSLEVDRADVVEAELRFPGGAPAAVRVVGPDGRDVPAQLAGTSARGTRVLFVARAPSVGYAVYDVRPATSVPNETGALHVSESGLENARYKVAINADGDVSSVFDKRLGRELLSAPIRLALQSETPENWPAWNMDWRDASAQPRGYVSGPARIRVVENGPARVAVEITRMVDSSTFVQTVRLAAGGERVELANAIDWRVGATALKAVVPLAAASDSATYNWDVGTIRRGVMSERKFEVPSHQFVDQTARDGSFGATLLTDAKNGSDKFDANTLRLTLLYSPGISPRWSGYGVQATQDWGHHDILFGLAGHGPSYRADNADWEAWRLNQPLLAFATAPHAGASGKSVSLLRTSSPRVRVMAMKRAEGSDEMVVRVNDVSGAAQSNVRLTFAGRVLSARELDGQERPLGSATVTNGALVTSLTPFGIRTFAVRLAPAPSRVAPERGTPLTLAYDLATASRDGAASSGGIDAAGRALPAEMLPDEIAYAGVTFHLAPAAGKNAVVARGQTLALPGGKATRVYVLAAAADGDRPATFRVGGRDTTVTVQAWTGMVGQWDARRWHTDTIVPNAADSARFAARQAQVDSTRRAHGDTTVRVRPTIQPRHVERYVGLTPGFIKPAPVAWFASHHHTAAGKNVAYAYSYLYAYALDVPAGATSITLPNDDRVRVFAVTAADAGPATRPAQPLFDELERR